MLLPTPTYLQPTPIYFHSSSAHSHSFSAHSHPLPLKFIPVLLILSALSPICILSHPFPVHIQILSPNPTHHLPFQPIFSPCVYVPTCFTHLCAYVPSCFTCPCACVIYFYALYCLCLYTLCTFVCVNNHDYLFTLCFLKTFFPPMVSLPIFFSAFISLMLQKLKHA